MSNEIIEFYKNASAKKEELAVDPVQETNTQSISSSADPFNSFLLELTDKLKNVKIDNEEKIDLIKEVVNEESQKNQNVNDSFANFLTDFSKILDKQKEKKEEEVKISTIQFINNLKDKSVKPLEVKKKKSSLKISKKIPKKIANKLIKKTTDGIVEIKEPLIENELKEEEPIDKNNKYVDQLKNIDKAATIPEKVKTKTDIKTYIAKHVKDEIEKFKIQFSKLALEGGGSGSVAVQYAKGGTMNGDLNVTGKYLSGGIDLSSIFGTGGGAADRLVSGSQSLILNSNGSISFPNNFIAAPDGEILTLESETNTAEISGYTRVSLSPFGFFAYDNNSNSISFSTSDNNIVIASQDLYEWSFNSEGKIVGPSGTLAVSGNVDVTNKFLSGGVDLADIFITSAEESQTLAYDTQTELLSITRGNSVSLSSLSDKSYANSNFLKLSGGIVSGNLTVQGNISALGTATFANTIFTTTSALSVYNTGPGPALYVYQAAGPYDVASFYDGDGIEVLHVGNAGPGGLGKVGVNESFPNEELTVRGSISATEVIYAENGNSTNWNTAYLHVSSQSLNTTDNVEFNQVNANVYLSGGVNLLQILGPTVRQFDYVIQDGISYNYCGTAPQGSLTSNSTWTIKRLLFTSAGTLLSSGIINNSIWDNRYSYSY